MCLYIVLLILVAWGIISAILYSKDMDAAYERLNAYDVKTIYTEFGETD